MNVSWPSVNKIKQLYWRHTWRHTFTLLALIAVVLGLLFQAFYALTAMFGLSAGAINVLFVLCGFVLLYAFGRCLHDWGREGFGLKSYFLNWEHRVPELYNRSTLLVYADRHREEVERLGYSEALLNADNHWLDAYMDQRLKRDPRIVSLPLAGVLALVVLSGAAQYTAGVYQAPELRRIAQALAIRSQTEALASLEIPAEQTVKRGEPLTLSAVSSQPIANDEGFIHIADSSGWQTLQAKAQGNRITYALPAVQREMRYYFSSGEQLSNQGRVIPLDAPRLAGGTITVTPPEYTGKPRQTIRHLRPFAAPQGSRVDLQVQSTSPLTKARFVYNDESRKLDVNEKALQAQFTVNQSGEFHFVMTDVHGLQGQSRSLRATMIPDATPAIEILEPGVVANVPDLMVQNVQLQAKDDYQVQQIYLHSQINSKKETDMRMKIWENTGENTEQIGGATQIGLAFKWDLAKLRLFPGDELTYYLEAVDNDPAGPKQGRSQTHILRYPSLTDLLAGLEQQEDEHVRELNNIVEKQEKITQDAKETIEQYNKKMEQQPAASDEEPKETWLEQQKLEELQKRQEELVKEAEQLEQKLNQYEQQAKDAPKNQQALSPEQRETFTPETLEKMERIRELLNQVLDKDSRDLMKNLEETVQKMAEQVSPEEMKDLEFKFENFEQQLDRTLSMLESTYQLRQLDGLQQTMQDLAQRQDHLKRETDQIAEQREELAKQIEALWQDKPADNPDGSSQANQGPTEQSNAEGRQGEQGESADTQEGSQEELSSEPSKAMQEWQQQMEQLQQQMQELQSRESALENRQQRMEEETQNLMDRMESLSESMQEQSPQMAQQLQQMAQMAMENQLLQEMRRAQRQLSQSNPQQASPHQQNAQQQLQHMAEQMQQQMQNMGGMNMQAQNQELRRLVDRCLFLSHQLETITGDVAERKDPLTLLQLAQAFQREAARIQTRWEEMAQANPFMSRNTVRLLRRAQNELGKAIEAGRGQHWVGVHESRLALMAINDALSQMQQDSQNMQQQMRQQQSGAQSLQQQMQQMISQQQSLQQMLQQLRQSQSKQDQAMLQQLQEMAQRQARIRQEINKMMEQYRHSQQLKNRLQGIYQEMKEVESLLEEGDNSEEVAEKQKRIMTRMLEAGTMQEKDEFGNERKAEAPKSGTEGTEAPESVPMTLEEKLKANWQRPDPEEIPLQYREALKNHFKNLSENWASE